ncbi:hypothetical protein N8500_09090 [Candidatus Puniceispirillum sp.]|nr:hypothetical protein [Candidatus Puniceispirillum sp.]
MSPQIALRVIGGGLICQGLLFFAFAAPLTLQIFPGASDEAVHVGTIVRRGLATTSFLAGLVIFLISNDTYRTIKRVLFGCGIGFAAMSFSMLKIISDEAAFIPLPAIGIYSVVALYALYLAFQK